MLIHNETSFDSSTFCTNKMTIIFVHNFYFILEDIECSVSCDIVHPATIKARCHYQSFPSKTLSKCLLSLSKFCGHLCQIIGGKSCKHEKMAPTLTNYENIAVTMSNEHCNP